jgi:chromosome segregation ATPase
MNPSLTALMTRLKWQNNELSFHLHSAEEEMHRITLHIKEMDQRIEHSCISSLIINPELEINKLNFLTQQHEKKNELLLVLKNQQDLITQLKDKVQRIKTEQKMLERYMERQQQEYKEQQTKAQEHTLEEWVVQKRKSL